MVSIAHLVYRLEPEPIMENVADRAVQRIHGLIAPGETVLPSNERVARELAKYPKSERRLIWKRAQQIANRSWSDYRAIREAAKEIVPAREAQKIWMGELIERLRNALRLLTISVDLSGASEESMRTVSELLVRLEKAISELSIHAGAQLDRIQKTNASEKAALHLCRILQTSRKSWEVARGTYQEFRRRLANTSQEFWRRPALHLARILATSPKVRVTSTSSDNPRNGWQRRKESVGHITAFL